MEQDGFIFFKQFILILSKTAYQLQISKTEFLKDKRPRTLFETVFVLNIY